jgi:hypothetical protein
MEGLEMAIIIWGVVSSLLGLIVALTLLRKGGISNDFLNYVYNPKRSPWKVVGRRMISEVFNTFKPSAITTVLNSGASTEREEFAKRVLHLSR